MLEKSAKSPKDKLLALFSVLDNWISAPGIREQLGSSLEAAPSILHCCPDLTSYLNGLAKKAGSPSPHTLVSQLLILLQGAIIDELRNPSHESLKAAENAAKAILAAQTRLAWARHWKIAGFSGFSAVTAAVITILLYPHAAPKQSYQAPTPYTLASNQHDQLSPDTVEKVLALQSRIDSGICPAPQLFTMPQDQVAIYMDIVHFRSLEHPAADSRKLREFLNWYAQSRSWECYYRPVNGHTAVSWVRK